MAQVSRHRFTLAGVYDLPIGQGRTFGSNMNRVLNGIIGGWQVSSIVTWRSGLPVDVSLDPAGTNPVTGQPINFNLIPNDYGDLRPDRVGTPNTGISPSDNRFNFLNVAAFQLQAPNTPGNSQRNVAHGPRFGSIDMSLVKAFRLSERMNLQFRGDAFNFLNHTNYQDPSQTTWGDDGFGVIDNAYDPRVIQLALRLQF